jgi:hypothetical protein
VVGHIVAVAVGTGVWVGVAVGVGVGVGLGVEVGAAVGVGVGLAVGVGVGVGVAVGVGVGLELGVGLEDGVALGVGVADSTPIPLNNTKLGNPLPRIRSNPKRGPSLVGVKVTMIRQRPNLGRRPIQLLVWVKSPMVVIDLILPSGLTSTA